MSKWKAVATSDGRVIRGSLRTKLPWTKGMFLELSIFPIVGAPDRRIDLDRDEALAAIEVLQAALEDWPERAA